MRELVSKVEGGCMSACFHMASRARTRAARVGFEGIWTGLEGVSGWIWPELGRSLEGNCLGGKLTGF